MSSSPPATATAPPASRPTAAITGGDGASTASTGSSNSGAGGQLISRREFDAEQFDAAGWVNAQLRSGTGSAHSRSSGGDLPGSSSALVQTLVMKLQLMSADVQSSLAQASADLFTALPKAVRELSWLGAETGSVRVSLHSLLSDAYSLDKQQHAQVQFLSAIDSVKRRVSRVSSQLSEMDSWRRKQDHLQAVLDSRDLYRIAAELQSLQSSVDQLSALPAHYTVNQQHQVRLLQDRLEELSEPALLAGLRTKDVSGVARLCSIYLQMGKAQLMQRLYTAFRTEQVDAIARTYVASAPAPVSGSSSTALSPSSAESAGVDASYQHHRLRALPTWLPAYYSDVSQLLIEEGGWGAAVSGSDSTASSFTAITAAVAERMSGQLSDWLVAWQSVPAQQPSERLAALHAVFASSVEFVLGVLRLFRAQYGQLSVASLQAVDNVIRVLLEPYRRLHSGVADTQKQSMLAAIEAVDMAAEEYDSAVGVVLSCLPLVLSCTADCVDQCLSLTGGLSAVASLSALRSCIDELLSRLLSVALRLRRLRDKDERRARRELDRSAVDDPLAGAGDEWSGLSGLFALIAAVRKVELDGLRTAESHIRQRLLAHVIRTLAIAQKQDTERRDAQADCGDAARQQAQEDAADEEADAGGEDDRLGIFAILLRGDEPNRRALEDTVEKHHVHGLAAIQPRSSRDLLEPLTAMPKHRLLNPAHSQPAVASSASAVPVPVVSPLLCLHSSFVALLRLLLCLHDDVYELLFAPLAARLRSFASWKQWRSSSSSAADIGVVATELREDGTEGDVALPSFSLQPSEYAVGVGEYLLTAVQQIEPFVSSRQQHQLQQQQRDDELEGGDGSSGSGEEDLSCSELDASYWLQRLSSGTCSLLCASICELPSLALQSHATCRQLAADLDYVANVLQAINISMEPELLAVMDAVSCGSDEQVKQRYGEMSSANEQYTLAARTVLESRMGAARGHAHAAPHAAANAAASKVK